MSTESDFAPLGVLDAITDEIIRHLESTPDSRLPSEFEIRIPPAAFARLLSERRPYSDGTTAVVGGHYVQIRSDQ